MNFLQRCQQFAEVLTQKNIKAFAGCFWDGYCDYKESEFWYFYFFENSDIGVYRQTQIKNGTEYDAAFIAGGRWEEALTALKQLPSQPDNKSIWSALDQFLTE